MSTPYASWMQAWGPLVDASLDVNTGTQTQNITAFNGAGNINVGDFAAAATQNVGDAEYTPIPGISPLLDASTDINTGIQEQNVTAFNGEGNLNLGSFTAVAEQNVGDMEMGAPSSPVLEDLSLEDNFGAQTQNVTAFNGAGNVNAGDFTVAAIQNVGDTEMPGSAGSLIDGSTDFNTGVQTQDVTAFNGAGNVNAGDFTIVAQQNVGDIEMPGVGSSLLDGSSDFNTGMQTQNVTAFNGAGNVNEGNFTVIADQNVGDTEVPTFDDIGA